MKSIIAFALLILINYNMIYLFTKRQKIATKYKDPNHYEEGTVRGIGEEYKKEVKKLIIRFAIVVFVLLFSLFLLFI